VGILTTLRAGIWSSIHSRSRYLLLLHPHWVWGPCIFLSNGH